MEGININFLNNVKERFLPLPRNAVDEYEHEPNISDFEIKKELGIGSYGKVYLVAHKKTKAEYALKVIDKTDIFNEGEKRYFNREIEIMYKLNHPNIVKLYSHFEDNKNCYFLMEYIPNGTVYDLIPKNGKKQDNVKMVASIMKDLISSIYYLHNMNPKIMHRDIKPENILLDEKGKGYLVDFGWSNYIINNRRRNSICGTPYYLSPEMVNETGHDEKVDIWSIGVLLYELMTGKVPFEGNDIDQVVDNITNLTISWPFDINSDVKDLISKILKLNPNERYNIEKILNHNFFKKYFPNAVNELIKPNIIKHKVFVVSVDTPDTFNQSNKPLANVIKNKDESYNIIKRTHTMNISKSNYKLSPSQSNKKNLLNRNNNTKINTNNYNSNYNYNSAYNTNNNNSHYKRQYTTKVIPKYKKLPYTSKYPTNNYYNNNRIKININNNNRTNSTERNSNYKGLNTYNYNTFSSTSDINSNNNYRRNGNNNNNYKAYNINKTKSIIENENGKFSDLSKRYELLKKECENMEKNGLEKLRTQLNDIEIKLLELMREKRYKDIDNVNSQHEFMKIKQLYEKVRLESNKLKEKIKNYSNNRCVRDYNSNNQRQDRRYKYNNLNASEEIQKNINGINFGKKYHENNYRKEIKIKIEKEKINYLINKYDRTIISQKRFKI